jgi:Concanavalin A-like lectin/glucanases superfamily
MRKLWTLFLGLFIMMNYSAAQDTLFVYKSGVVVSQRAVADIDSVTFSRYTFPTNGLVAWYPFNGNANDSSGNANNGIVTGATLTTDRFGVANSAYSFDGTNGLIRIPNSSSLTIKNNTFSMSFWLNVNTWQANSTEYYFLAKHSGVGAAQIGFHTYIYKSAITMRYLNGNGSDWGFTSTNTYILPNAGTWFHVAYTVNSTENKMYINGVLVDTQVAKPMGLDTSDLYIGKDPIGGGSYCPGKIDDVAFYNRTLTQSEITNLYHAK